MIFTKETFAKVEQHLTALNSLLNELHGVLMQEAQVAEVRSVGEDLPARNLLQVVDQSKGWMDEALEKCRQMKAGEVPLTEESCAELAQIMNQATAICDSVESEYSRSEVKQHPNANNGPIPVQDEQDNSHTTTGVPTSGLDTLSGIEFEGLITRLLERMGFRAKITKASGDGGIDVVATLDQPITGGRYLIQCKRYAPDSPVGAATVREFYGALTADRGAVKGILITTSGFTGQAEEFAVGLPIELIGRDQLQRLLAQHDLLAEGLSGYPGSAGGLSPPPEQRAVDLVDLAMKMAKQENDVEAIKVLKQAIQLRPDYPMAWLRLGMCYNSLCLHDDAIAALREALRLEPYLRVAWDVLGRSLHDVDDLDAAINAFEHANAIDSDNANTWLELGTTYNDKGLKEAALLAVGKAVKIRPDWDMAWIELGMLRRKQGEYREALSATLEAVRIDPNSVLGWSLLCMLYYNLGDRARMRQAVNRLVQLAPSEARKWQSFVK